MDHSPTSLFANALAEAVEEPTFVELNRAQKLDIECALERGAARLLGDVMREVCEVMSDPARFTHSLSRKYAAEAIGTMRLASAGAQRDCVGIDVVKEAADRLAAEAFLPISRQTGVALLHYGLSAGDVLVKADGTTAAGQPCQLAAAAGVTIYEVVADMWLRARGHEWACPGGPNRTTHQAAAA